MEVTQRRIRAFRPNGGHLYHAVPLGSHKAVCGYAPSSPKNVQFTRGRGRWIVGERDDPERVTCKRCRAVLETQSTEME